MPLSPGDSLDHYVIETLLGEGGMGAVYRALDTRLERRVALKILRPASEARSPPSTGAGPTSDGPSKLLREARAAAALDHPNATAIFDVGEVDGVAYIAMELVDGRSLRAYVGDRTVPFDRRIRWLVDIGSALSAAHARGLVHRDVKPENVIVRADGVVKVLDFGIARRVKIPNVDPGPNTDGYYPTLTEAGLVLGTPHYMAPEQLRGEPVDGRADQFSWGIVAFELLTGKLPWTEQTSGIGLVSEILSKDPPSMRADGAALPAAVEATIRKALSKSARDRFATIDDAVEMIEPYGAATSSDHRRVDSTEPPPPLPKGAAAYPTSGSVPGPAMVSARQAPLAERAPPRRLPLVLGAAIVVAVGVAFVVTQPTTLTSPPAASEAPSVSAVASHLAITDVPAPRTASGEVAAAYLAGVQGIRDASFGAATTNLARAATLDPSLAVAHLKLAWLYTLQGNAAAARVEGRRAELVASSLGGRDRALLAAIEPSVVAQPADGAEAERRLAAASVASPGDAEIAFVLARVRHALGDGDGARRALDLAITDDPSFAAVEWARGVDAEDAGDVVGAAAAYTRCLETSPSAASCLHARGMIAARRGDCAAVEADARRMLAVEPSGWRGYEALARALVARGSPTETVREALKHEWLFVPDGERAWHEQMDEARLAVLQGDFAGAEARMRDLQKLGASTDGGVSDVDPAAFLVAIHDEEGGTPQAVRGALTDDVVARLRAVSATCLAFDDPFAHTRAFADLGRALEASGDKAGACDAYATVLTRWGRATPHSVTATAVAARGRALGCAKR